MDTIKRMSDGLVSRTLVLAKAYSDVELDKTERGLEEEIRRESFVPPPERKLARFRRNGELILHSKHVLLAVVILNLIDCALVLGELMLDIHYIKELRENSETSSQAFIDKMEERYPNDLYGHDKDHMNYLYDKIYLAECYWKPNNSQISLNMFRPRRRRTAETSVNSGPEYLFRPNSSESMNNRPYSKTAYQHEHSIWEEVAHGMHKASICILGILFVENLLKVIFMGSGFFTKKLEVFDAVVVIVSFIVDLVFLKGLSGYKVQDALLILSFLLPWRVIRVVNSLIVAVLDHEHFRLKMLYQDKKAISAELKVLKEKEKKWDFHLHRIEQFCESEGIPKWKIRQHTAMGRKQSTITSMASLALNGLLSGMLTGPEDHALFARSISLQTQGSNDTATNLGAIDENENSPKGNGGASSKQHFATISESEDETEFMQGSNSDSVSLQNNCSDASLLERQANYGKKRVSFEGAEQKPLLTRQHQIQGLELSDDEGSMALVVADHTDGNGQASNDRN